MALISAGAFGNAIDRMRLGVVVDYIDVFWKNLHWPAFNIADSCITIGVMLMIADMLVVGEPSDSSNRTV